VGVKADSKRSHKDDLTHTVRGCEKGKMGKEVLPLTSRVQREEKGRTGYQRQAPEERLEPKKRQENKRAKKELGR